MTRRRVVIGNWKMNTTLEEATGLASQLEREITPGEEVVVGIAPPFPWLQVAQEVRRGGQILVGAQTCAATNNGAYTGEVSAAMLAEFCDFVLIGHSERRSLFGETDSAVREKLLRALFSRYSASAKHSNNVKQVRRRES
jgi:triosephosphate isomerase